MATTPGSLPLEGRDWSDLRGEMESLQAADPAKWRDKKSFGMVYPATAEISRIVHAAYSMFFAENFHHVHAFPSLRKFELDVVAMTARLLHLDAESGNVVSGGTEAALVALKAVRDQARVRRGITEPEIVLPATAYPVYNMIADYLNVKAVRVPIGADFRADVSLLAGAINDRTVMLVGSAPGWSYGIVDPIEEMAQLATARDIHLHVDASVGGCLLPFVRKLGYPVPAFDFGVHGVASMVVDLHKFAYAAQGTAVVLYRDAETYRYQNFEFPDWPMGVWKNPALLTSRPGGSVAAAWAVLNHLGESGYLALTKVLMDATRRMQAGVDDIDGLFVMGHPEACLFAYSSSDIDMRAIAEGMKAKGWFIRRQANSPSIHVVLTPNHAEIVDAYLADLRDVAGALA